ncbi:4-(cytidine 5'-diphospho)-2-C-methyl-D-erythritol kinase [Nocardiopsis changdeensis]|uniref:4-diphosphocytidyl-2-C-methyl-D-erythritol kinase n=1 Tax=Nocardiopsis changdeensis TaxID=2831969 RepID=A0ABX8BRB2_9ACTN|nr:4-(cytidine 5'-diphospho)-2-C-methyl-D-erythritol kinase [Nocardiopsis changdeensis]QUX23632.1 4-(cytidine 5'-diphospho)-2-C-methyl-D-erythritol kinase [Nocardiopsis changdeensis]QYX39576.1 4-(cytidine 5'-diphospho)-2-C-methyl-D-erythritol kinase [Nocardiopsis sp. MT53]
MTVDTTVTVRVPAKVNLQLAVGPAREDGFHDLVNVFHAVSLFDEVTVREAGPRSGRPDGSTSPGGGTLLAELTANGRSVSHLSRVPLDASNLAAGAADLLGRETGRGRPVRIHLEKRIPVAGGMAGGSADAAAALVACDRLWATGLPREDLLRLAAVLGSDVAFPLVGGTAVGRGRGEILEPMTSPGRYRWVFALSPHGLSTGAVFAEYDRLRPDAPAPELSAALRDALAAADPAALGRALTNDLQEAALSLLPELERTLRTGASAGALGALVSGSGPTCAFLVGGGSEEASVVAEREAAVVASLEASGLCEQIVRADGDVPGTVFV